jgi:hypothetical protein
MDERISFVTHQGKAIMLIDFSHCQPKEILLLLEEIPATVARHQRGSLLTLVVLHGARIDRAVATRMKEVLVLDRPYVKRSAWVGAESVPKVYHDNLTSFSQRQLPSFKTREEAMDWLVQDEAAPTTKT